MSRILLTILIVASYACSTYETVIHVDYNKTLDSLPSIEGKRQYLNTPYVAAGNRVYAIGHQDGSFPDLGWHVEGEMGGIWDHPIKLMDGFSASIKADDSSFCLNQAEKFMNYPVGNVHYFQWLRHQLTIERFQFVPDSVEGLVVVYTIKNNSNTDKKINFSFTGHVDLRPTWLGERTNMNDAEDDLQFDKSANIWIGKDKSNPWFTVFGSSLSSQPGTTESNCIVSRRGKGKDATLEHQLLIKPSDNASISFFIAGSYHSEDEARKTYSLLKTHADDLLTKKVKRFRTVDERSQLTLQDKGVQQMYQWMKYNTEWLARFVPEQGYGLSAGLPDYPWWFGADATYALQGVLATGDHELVKNTIKLLLDISRKTNDNGRIIHEVSTNGAVYNPGNLNETAQFITLVYNYYKWTGDQELLIQAYPELKKGIDYLLKDRDPDNNQYPNGSGMMEIPGLESELEMIDVAVYTQQAISSMAIMAEHLKDQAASDHYHRVADVLKLRINQQWWNPLQKSYGDFLGTKEEAITVLDAAMIRADTLKKPWSVKELKSVRKGILGLPQNEKRAHVIYHNWVVNTPMETGVATTENARAALETTKKYENAFGLFVTGIDRTDEPDSVVLKSRKKTFSYTGAVMTLPTGVQAVASARYGYSDDALGYIKKLQQSFSYALPGSMYEVSPDFGMVSQAWNIYGVAVPIVHYFFGIDPRAYDKTILIDPQMPSSWTNASIENVKVGNNSIDLKVVTESNKKVIWVEQSDSSWKIRLNVNGAKEIKVNDVVVQPEKAIEFTGVQNKIILTY